MTIRFSTFVWIVVTCVGCSKTTPRDEEIREMVAFFPYDKQSFDWSTIEISVSDTERKQLADSIPWLSNMYSDSVYLSEIHSIDFNGDGRRDFIYSGAGPTDDWITIVRINLGGKFDYFDLEGRVVDMRLDSKRVSTIFTISVVATSPGIEGHRIVKVDYKNDLPVFTTIFKSEKVEWTPLPNNKEVISFDFESIVDTLILRDSPIELDTPFNDFLEINGNQFGKITKGTKGRIIGQRTDSLKNAWLCVLIYPNREIIDYPLYMNGKFDPADSINRIGWIKDEGIRRVE